LLQGRTIWLFIAGFAVLLLVMAVISFYLDLLWFQELQAENVFWTQHLTRWGLRLGAWLLLFAFLFVNLLLTRRRILSFPNLALREQLMASGYMRLFTPRRLTGIFLILAGILSYLFSGYTAGHWMDVLRFANAASFGVPDPIFGQDVAFYVFGLPFYRFIYGYLMLAVVATLIIVGIIYYILNAPALGQKRWLIPPDGGLAHISVLMAVAFALKAWDYRLQQFELLLSPQGRVFGAGYTDVNASLHVLWVLAALAALLALIFLANTFLRRPRILVYGFGLLVAVSLIGGSLYPTAVQKFWVEPSELAYERQYLAHNIEFTRRAFGLDQIHRRPYSVSHQLTWADLAENPGTLNNVRLWDHRPLSQTINQIQAFRPYYRFHDVDIDRYTVDGQYRQVMLSAREIDKSRLETEARSWVNLRLHYTHGYGATVSPVNEVSPDGLPRFLVRDIPPVTVPGLALTEPSIYFGELTADYVIANTNTPEFHYTTEGEENVFTSYAGQGGIALDSFWRRLFFALKFGDYRILVSGELTGESRIMFDRRIQDRVAKIAPFLQFDEDPYIVINEGRLFWIQDAYTTTARYPYATPYATPFGRLNYIRNSVKVVVDAYHGSVDFYLVDLEDPLAVTLGQIFPDLFKPLEEMPPGLTAHLRYPVDLFQIQAGVLTLYHTTDTSTVYSRVDLWALPTEKYERDVVMMEPYYTILQLSGYTDPEFVLILPFTPARRDNMIAWMVARNDQPHYGQVELFLFPKGQTIYGPRQIENRIDANTDIAQQLTLWDQAGSRVIRGNLLVLPINDALLYVEPVFLVSEHGGLPEIGRVIVAFQDTVVMERTLEQALVRLFGERGLLPPDVPVDPDDPADPDDPVIPRDPSLDPAITVLIKRAQQVFSEAQQRQREGDWAGYGAKISELEQILADLARLIE
jgi:uncharacterized protein